jgi:hypothetical protein
MEGMRGLVGPGRQLTHRQFLCAFIICGLSLMFPIGKEVCKLEGRTAAVERRVFNISILGFMAAESVGNIFCLIIVFLMFLRF